MPESYRPFNIMDAAQRIMERCLWGSPTYQRKNIASYAQNWASHPTSGFIKQMKQRSMLHYETLTLLDYFASRTQGAILEIGAFTGSATVVLAKAMLRNHKSDALIAVERGGAKEHPHVPSKNVLADLHNTLLEFGVSEKVRIIEGQSGTRDVTDAVLREVGDQKIGVLLMDADGKVSRDFSLYQDLLADGAIIICDDYSGDRPKTLQVKSWVDEAVRTGIVCDLGFYQWGTWFGQYNASRARILKSRQAGAAEIFDRPKTN